MCSQPSQSPEYFLDEPIDNPMIYHANIDLGYKDNIFDVLGGNLDNFVSLCYLSGCNASLYLCSMYLVGEHRKIM